LVVEGNPGVTTMVFTVAFDEAAMRLVGFEDKGLLSGANHAPRREDSPSSLTLAWQNALTLANNTANGALAVLEFELLEDAKPGEYAVELSYLPGNVINANLRPVYFGVESGTVSVMAGEGEGEPGEPGEEDCEHNIVTDRLEATETEDGYIKVYCDLCGEVFEDEVIPATGEPGPGEPGEPGEPEEPGDAVLVGATADAGDFIGITETGKNTDVWDLVFTVAESWSDGEVVIVTHTILIYANNANVDGQYDLGAYTLVYDIKGNGSNVKEFYVIMN